MDPFDVDHAYEPDGDRLVIADDDATFTDFAASTETVFTRGASDSIRFADRPMWLSVDTSGTDTVAFEAHDATDDGQAIRVDASWLESHGVAEPVIAYYHDGTTIPVEATADGSAYVVDAPHFSHIRITTVDLDTSWKQEGHTRGFFADGPSDSGTFNITVSEVTSGEIEFRFWSVQNGSRNVFDGDETFEKVDRESLDQSGYYTFNFINETNLGTGYAMLGDDQYHLDKVNLNLDTYDFTNGDLTYRFDQTTGFLEEVVDDGNGAAISLQDVRTDTVPGASADAAQEADLTEKPAKSHAEWDNTQDPVHKHENAEPPEWTGGDPDYVVQGSILDDRTDVRASAQYTIELYIVSLADCRDVNCHVRGHTKYFHVHWDDGHEKVDEDVTCPDDGSDVCANDLDQSLYECNNCRHSLTGTVKHDECEAAGLLCEGSVDFWVCAYGEWDSDNRGSAGAGIANVGCAEERPWHPDHDNPHGQITVDPLEGLP